MVSFLFQILKTRCASKANRMLKLNKIVKDTGGNPKANAYKNNTSPRPKVVFKKPVFRMSLVYTQRIPNRHDTKTTLAAHKIK